MTSLRSSLWLTSSAVGPSVFPAKNSSVGGFVLTCRQFQVDDENQYFALTLTLTFPAKDPIIGGFHRVTSSLFAVSFRWMTRTNTLSQL